MSLENTIKETSSGLSSVRVSDRKKSAETLKSYLCGNAAPALITDNTLNKKGYTWNDLFGDIHDYVLKETEKYETSKTFEAVTAPLCGSLLQLCVSGANKGRAYIRCEKIAEASLFILRDKRLLRAIGDAYSNLLYKYVLTCDHYISYITPKTWEDLLEVFLDLCNVKCKIDDFTKLRLIWVILRNARNYCQFVIPTRDSLKKLKKIFHKFTNCKEKELTIEILIILLNMLSSECRFTMCEFTESVLRSLINSYDQNMDVKKKGSLFKCLHLTIVLHHPQGTVYKETDSVAYDWDIWNQHLQYILEVVSSEVIYMQKFKKQFYDQYFRNIASFYSLTASAYHQIFKTIGNVERVDVESSSKKQKISINKNKSFNDIIDELRQNHLPWIGVIHIYLKNFNESINFEEYVSLLNALEGFLALNNADIDWNVLEQVTCITIKNLTSSKQCKRDDYEQILLMLWNSCVRNSSTINPQHKSIHCILQTILQHSQIQYQNVYPLIKMYYEKTMPVTDDSTATMICVFNKCFALCGCIDKRRKCFEWLVYGNFISVNSINTRNLLLRLISNENVGTTIDVLHRADTLYDIIIHSNEKCILFSEFKLDIDNENKYNVENKKEIIIINMEMHNVIQSCLQQYLLDYTTKLKKIEIELVDYVKLATLVVNYIDLLIQYDLITLSEIQEMELYRLMKNALSLAFDSLTKILKDDLHNNKNLLLSLTKNILLYDFNQLLNTVIRESINDDLFLSMHDILNADDRVQIDENLLDSDDETNPYELKHNCIYVLAAYCRKKSDYQEQILNLIMDPKLYDLTLSWDIECGFQCIHLLLDNVPPEDIPLNNICFLLQGICKVLFRDTKVTKKILHILLKTVDQMWLTNNLRQNCLIMVKSFLLRCEKGFYPPDVVVLVYECVAKITALNQNEDNVDKKFIESLIGNVKGSIHSVRLYCCYLLQLVVGKFSEAELSACLTDLFDIFTINVSDTTDEILKDETANRNSTLLHALYAMAKTRKPLTNKIVVELLLAKNDKGLNESLVKKVLNLITLANTSKSIEYYLNDNILFVIQIWFSKKKTLLDIPLHIFGFERFDVFLEKHLKWLTTADILWRKQGRIDAGEVSKLVQTKFEKSEKEVVEMCFGSIMILCLPFIAMQKYGLNYEGRINQSEYRRTCESAQRMFQMTRQILDNEKWTDLFVESMGELVLTAVVHMRDCADAQRIFNIEIPEQNEIFVYSKKVFLAILKYFGELIEGDIMQYLCENQPLAIFKILFILWENVIKENILELKLLEINTFVTFVQNVPLNHSSDAFVCNFCINSVTDALKLSKDKKEIKVFIEATKITLSIFLPEKCDILQKALSKLKAVLLIKKEEGYISEYESLMRYLNDMKSIDRRSQDLVDFTSQTINFETCTSTVDYVEKLETYSKNLNCPSRQNLMDVRQFLKLNKSYTYDLSQSSLSHPVNEPSLKTIHDVINKLTNILKSSFDDKIKIEACNCLAEIGTYDLKSLVTVLPKDSTKILHLLPKQYFANAVVGSLVDVVYSINPQTSHQVTETLHDMLKYKDCQHIILDAEEFNKDIIKPLLSSHCEDFADFKIENEKFGCNLSSVLWIPLEKESHSKWLSRTTTALLDIFVSSKNYIQNLSLVCTSQVAVCQKILPSLVGLILHCASENQIRVISEQINKFFVHIYDISFELQDDSSGSNVENSNKGDAMDHDYKMIIQYMLDVVNFVRIQRNHYKPRPKFSIETLNFLKLEYNKVAWAATIADQNLSAIFYSELWALAQNDGIPPASPEQTALLDGGENVQKILRKCLVTIGEMEAIEGCGTAHLTSEHERLSHLVSSGRHADALALHDAALCAEGAGAGGGLRAGLVRALHAGGLYHLALHYINSIPENEEFDHVKYDCLSSLGDWSYFVDTKDIEKKCKFTNENSEVHIKALRYACLKDCLSLDMIRGFETKLMIPINRAKYVVSKLCQSLNMENCQNVYKVLSHLQLFNDIEDYFSARNNKISVTELLNRWDVDKLPPHHDLRYLEPLISQRSLILEHAEKSHSDFSSEIVSLLLKYAELGLSNQRLQMVQRLLATVKKMRSSDDVALVESRISWFKGHKDIALSLLRKVTGNTSSDSKLKATSLRQYALWMAESKCANSRDIIDKYLMKSLEALKKSDDVDTRLKVYHDIARFGDAEYKQVELYMNSSIFEDKLKCVESMKHTATNLKSQQIKQLTKDEKKALHTNERFTALDEAEIANTRAEKNRFLQLAMRYYLMSLFQNEENNLSLFRVISLWLENPNIQLDEYGNSFEELLHKIPSRKFITALPQLAPRLTDDDSAFVKILKKIIERCALEHPHHTLPILFSLKNSDKDKYILNASQARRGQSSQQHRSQESRVVASDHLIEQLARVPKLSAIISQMEIMCDATISFANYVPKTKHTRQQVPNAEPLYRIRNLNAIPIPIVTTPVRDDCNYSYLSTLVSFETYFELVGGVNCPKKITCTSSNGQKKILLIKGEDDLRQDAVMQQVFTIVNTLLEKNPVTNKNKLLIRTYKFTLYIAGFDLLYNAMRRSRPAMYRVASSTWWIVRLKRSCGMGQVVPMSRRSGVLEWCEGTIPMGAYLVGSEGAHARYRPQDISCSAARTKLNTYYETRKSNSDKLAAFLKILTNLKPVFHYFFTEHYHDPVTWYERRLAYTKSVAASSMVGYILGLGDRHVQNILIDKKTAEVIHIDFGIAFDQGKTLPTPETVPFRLTQDMVAGFGCSGVEGIFRSCCEKTMQLLRDNQETLLTILEVLLCDPLYSWTVTSTQQKLPVAQDITNNKCSNSGLAARALLAVRSKLCGAEGGSGVAARGQVARLLLAAADPANLSRLYPGWQPYL